MSDDQRQPRRGRARVWKLTALVALSAILLAATGYVAALSYLWSARVDELEAAAAELESQRVAAEADRDAAIDALAAADEELEEAQAGVLVSANHAVVADDVALYFTYAGKAMVQCIDASENVAFYVRTKWTSPDVYPWNATHDYDDDVRKACRKIERYFDEAAEDYDAKLAGEPTTEDDS